MGRPEGINFSVRKNVKITEDQNKKWDISTPKLIRDLLEGKLTLDTQILKKMIPKFIEYGIKLETTTELEDKRIMEMIEECQ